MNSVFKIRFISFLQSLEISSKFRCVCEISHLEIQYHTMTINCNGRNVKLNTFEKVVVMKF